MPCWTSGVPNPNGSCDEQAVPGDELTAHERLAARIATLADREATATVAVDASEIGNFAMCIRAAFAVSSCSTESSAIADSQQTVIVNRDGH